MSKITMLDNEYATLWYYPELKLVYHVFHKYIHGQTFRDVLIKGLEVFKEKGADKWLSDDRNNSALTPEDSEWGITVWFNQIFESGWKYWAILMPDKFVGQLNMQRFIDDYSAKGLTIQIFEEPEEAMEWLKSV